MKGVIAIAIGTFKWGAGIFLGFVGLCVAVYLFFIVLGLIGLLAKRRQDRKVRVRLEQMLEDLKQPPAARIVDVEKDVS